MRRQVLDEQLRSSADPQRARHYWEQVAGTSAAHVLKSISPERARVLLALFSGSQALSESLIAHPEWLVVLEPENLKFPRQKQGLQREVDAWLKPALISCDYADAF